MTETKTMTTDPMILNLTQHTATSDQIQAGVYEPEDKARVQELLTFKELPTSKQIKERARKLTQIAREEGASEVMLAGAFYLMGPLSKRLKQAGIRPVFAFTERVAVEVQQPDGSVKTGRDFRHLGWVDAC